MQDEATLFGTSVWTGDGSTFAEALARQVTAYGRLQVARVFHQGLPEAWPGKQGLSGGPVVVSFKAEPADVAAGRHDAFFVDWFAAAPRDRPVFWTFYHEPEDNIEDGAFTFAEYKDAYRRLAGLADLANNPHLKTTTIWMCYTLRPASGRDWRNYYPGPDVVDVMGFDCYNGAAAKGTYHPATALLDPMIAVAQSEGKPWGLGEFGSPLAAGDDGALRAPWLASVAGYVHANGAAFMSYYDAIHTKDGEAKDFRLTDAGSAASWRWAINEL